MRALVGFWILFAAAFLAPKTCSGVSDSSIPIDKTVRLLSNGAPKPESTNRKSATFFGSAFEFQTTTGEDNLNSYTMDDYLMPDPTQAQRWMCILGRSSMEHQRTLLFHLQLRQLILVRILPKLTCKILTWRKY
ncbi:hypothetical protein HPP92_013392 [Vanilla planifolia]|uniref:Uncharacterized protein n=1 Tax=Vanilla planifolia TaxID=51239 RepID=A0A835QSY5_VANPL|nr:hypothetical protein HPP92_013392 [Vanilla planifolia]